MPPGVDWDKFLGPAQMKPYSKNKFAYNWHWFWDTGNGDIGNQGVHEMDICLWGLRPHRLAGRRSPTGGKFVWKDDQETPNTLADGLRFGDAQITFDTRNLPTPPEGAGGSARPELRRQHFLRRPGLHGGRQAGFQVYKSTRRPCSGEAARGAAPAARRSTRRPLRRRRRAGLTRPPHMKNFLDAVRSRDYKKLTAEIEIGARSAAFCHLGNIAYRVGRELRMDQSAGRFIGDDEANSLLTRNYRAPYIVPDKF